MWAEGKAVDQAERKMWCSRSGAIRYVTGDAPRVFCTVGVRATGEKTARDPDRSFTVLC
jgi:hypothetical protein